MQTVGVQAIGLEVGGGDKAHTVVEQRHKQAVQDHRVGDVGHMELVKANQLVTLGHAFAQLIKRVDGALDHGQFAVHLAHEFVKVQTGFALDGHGRKKAVHQKTFAAPHPAKHVHALGNLRAAQELGQQA